MATQKRTTSTRKKTSGKKTSGRKSSANVRGKSSSAPTFTWRAELLLFAFLAFAILLFIGNIGKGGIVGNALSKFSFGMFGVLAYIFPIPVLCRCVILLILPVTVYIFRIGFYGMCLNLEII